VPITRANWHDAVAIRVGEGQLRFVAGYEPVALVILSKAFVRVGDLDWWPYLVEDAGDPIGVLALVDDRQRNGQVALFHLLIDASRQRCGQGRAALRLVIELARQLDGCERLRLTVHAENNVAINLYLSEGFTQDGVADDGELCLSASVS
jgi:diamine N-acetyltransferase